MRFAQSLSHTKLTSTKHLDLTLSVQNLPSTIVPVLERRSFSWGTVNGLTKFEICNTRDGSYRGGVGECTPVSTFDVCMIDTFRTGTENQIKNKFLNPRSIYIPMFSSSSASSFWVEWAVGIAGAMSNGVIGVSSSSILVTSSAGTSLASGTISYNQIN